MAFKMKNKSVMKLAKEAGDNRKVENKGKKVDPRTGMPKGVSKPPSDIEVANKDKIASLRAKYNAAEPFSDEQESIRQEILKLRGK
jgi:hypothetical protein|tara:strand:+ start:68 stop:325 length:258 start_codon:yes stop_codon:yes gene_type:complete